MSDFAERLEAELKQRYELCPPNATPDGILLAVLNAVAAARITPIQAAAALQCDLTQPKENEVETVDSTSDERTVNNVMRHQYRVLSDEEKAQMQSLKDKGLELHNLIESIGQSRELSLAKTKTEEAVMWAVKHITR